MSKSYRSLLATTVIAGFAVAAVPAYAQDAAPAPPAGATDTTAPGGATTPGQTEAGSTANSGPGVQAQDAVPPAQGNGGEIIVTGTLIRNPNLTSSSPVAVVGSEEIALRAPTSSEQILRTIPGVVPGLGQSVNNGANGTATVDLRGFGAKRNLVLLDSTRIVPANTGGIFDLNNIPIALIDRVDVLTGGASTTYGADAVTGVVNFITKKNFAGVDLQLNEQISERGDANVFRSDLTMGANFDDGRGNAVMAISYIESDPVYFGDRPLGECVINSNSGICGGDSATATPTAFQFTADQYANIGLDVNTFPLTPNIQIGPDGTLVPQYSTFNFNPYNVYQTPFKRYNGYAAAHYDISDNITVYSRAMFSKNYTSSIIAASGVFAEELTVPGNNPFLTPALRNQLCQLNGIALGAACDTNPAIPLGYVYRRSVEAGPRIDEQNTTMFDFKAGVTWNIWQNISFDLYGAYGESDVQQVRKNYIAKSRLQQALNASNADTCANPAGGCVPLNLFGPPGSITPEMAGFIGGIQSVINRGASLAQVHGVLSGDFGWTTPWANKPIAFAIGGEHRDYTAHTRPDALAQTPGELGGAGGGIPPTEGAYTAEDAFAELIVPIVADHPFFNELTLEGGVRRSHYDIDAPGNPSFNATTYKIGGTWAPVPEIKFRGNYQQAVRAPNISELFTPVATGLTALSTDPCAGAAPLTNANLAAVCVAQGAPLGSIGSIPNPTAGQANVTAGGNPNLKPETSHSWTVGVVLNPRSWLPGFNATVDYYNIKIKNAINAPLPSDIINACFANLSAASATDPACTSIHRNRSSGGLSGSPASVQGLPGPLGNNGHLATDGVDFTVNYKHGLGFGGANLILNLAGNWTHEAKFFASDTSTPPNCVATYSANCGISLGQLQPKWAWNQRTTLSLKPVDISLAWRHISGFHYQSDLPQLGGACAGTGGVDGCEITGSGPFVGKVVNFNRIPSFNYFDLTTRFAITDHFDLTLAAFNIFDKSPPIVGNNAGTTAADSGNTFPSTYDTLGRRYSATVRLKF